MSQPDPKIHVAFRFHVNFYHSYRDDGLDEGGFGKDIRIIRGIINDLDSFNSDGIPVKATWDFDNLFSLEEIIPRHAPDLIEAWQRRVSAGADEVNLMSYNNGLITAHTREEFAEVLRRTMSNPAGSGLADLFPVVRPIVRPQEMMFTPIHLDLYRAHGVEAISLFYSAVPFNGFSNFIPTLPRWVRHNPITLTYPGISGSMTLIPAFNHGDIGDRISLRRWLKHLHRSHSRDLNQLPGLPRHLLVLIDLDADDDFWAGIPVPVLKRTLSTAKGLKGIVTSIADLPFVRFDTPWEYLQSHPPVETVTIRQDTADGGFDGYSSWAEKWSNHRLWSGIERSRQQSARARLLERLLPAGSGEVHPSVAAHLQAALEARLRALSTTHFGLSMPVMNVSRLEIASGIVADSVEHARQAWTIAADAVAASEFGDNGDTPGFLLVEADATDAPHDPMSPARRLLRLEVSMPDASNIAGVATADDHRLFAAAVRPSETGGSAGTLFAVIDSVPHTTQTCRLVDAVDVAAHPASARKTTAHTTTRASASRLGMQNRWISLEFGADGHPGSLSLDGEQMIRGPMAISRIRYDGRAITVDRWERFSVFEAANQSVAIVSTEGRAHIVGHEGELLVRREYLIAATLPYLYLSTTVHYPDTPPKPRPRSAVARLGRTYDSRWEEVMPCEINLFPVRADRPYRVWKHNFCDHMSSYELDYHLFSRNRDLDSVNNHITNGWLALSGEGRGLLLAQSTVDHSSFAFCPLRTRIKAGKQYLSLNPFGTYGGRQLSYQTATTGIGKLGAMAFAHQLTSAAPSYAGREERFEVMIAPYRGDEPPEPIRRDAEAYANPPGVITDDPRIAAVDDVVCRELHDG